METELQSCGSFNTDPIVKMEVTHFLSMLPQQVRLLTTAVILYTYIDLMRQQIGELDENGNLTINSQFLPLFTGKQSTIILLAE